MLHSPKLIPPCAGFWDEAARMLLRSELLASAGESTDFSTIRVVVPTFTHVQLLRDAMARIVGGTFIPPRIVTLDGWLSLLPPVKYSAESSRVVALYAELRNHGWLKKLFSAKRNTDLLPLAQTLICLCDELTQSLLPTLKLDPKDVERRWQDALTRLSPAAQSVWSDEAQMVWTIWKSQIDAGDRCAARFAQMMRLAAQAREPLAWISPTEPSAFEAAFLAAYGERCTVLPVTLDWRPHMLHPACARAWPEAAAEEAALPEAVVTQPGGLRLLPAGSLEQEALQGAQTIVDWLKQGRSNIAVVAQDRVAARRLRALLERAGVAVADETGWKLSTTRAASLLAAWFDTASSNAETAALLDLLKSPYLAAAMPDREAKVMKIETALRRANVHAGWEAILAALDETREARRWIGDLSDAARAFAGTRRTVAGWVEATMAALDALGAREALDADGAGMQLLAVLEAMGEACRNLAERISLAEWRAFAGLEIEAASYIAQQSDRRVVMLPLNGARLRSFDAVLVVGADAANLPSRSSESLFFSNAVRAELGLATRESLQRQQLRDFSELLHANADVVLSWQSVKEGEQIAVSPWIDRLQLALARAGQPALPEHAVVLGSRPLVAQPVKPPAPRAAALLPTRISASAYGSLTNCPYQFFAAYMLELDGLDDVSDMPEKRDYGSWLHHILHDYHESLMREPLPPGARLAKLREISEQRFRIELERSAAALGYYVRWRKAMPAYVAWCEEHEKEGWRYEAGELKRESTLAFDGGETVLHGRIDRIDRNAAGELAVLDYKTQPLKPLKDKLKRGEDHQLAFYGLLFDEAVGHAHYVALEPTDGKTGSAEAPDYPQWRDGLSERATATLSALSKGAALPANGIESICEWCDVRGLCRKGAW